MGHHGTILAQKIKTVADAIGAVDPQGLQSGQVGREVGEAVLAQCGLCLTALTTARAADLEPDMSVAIALYGHEAPGVMTLPELQEWCLERTAFANEGLYRLRVQQALLQAGVWVGDLDTPDALSEDQANLATETGRYLQQVLHDARAAGVSDRMQVVWNATTITLAAATKLADYVATTGARRKQILTAAPVAPNI